MENTKNIISEQEEKLQPTQTQSAPVTAEATKKLDEETNKVLEKYLMERAQLEKEIEIQKQKISTIRNEENQAKAEKVLEEKTTPKTKKSIKAKVQTFLNQATVPGTDECEQKREVAARKEKLAKEHAIATKLAKKIIAKEKARKAELDKKIAKALEALEVVAKENGVQILKGDTPKSVKEKIRRTITTQKEAQKAILASAKNSEKLSKENERKYAKAQQEIAMKQEAVEKVDLIAKGFVDNGSKKLVKFEGKKFENIVPTDQSTTFSLDKYRKHNKLIESLTDSLRQSMPKQSSIYKRERDVILAQAMLLGLDQYSSTTHNTVILKDLDVKLAQIKFEYTSLIASATKQAEEIKAIAKQELDAELAKINSKYKRNVRSTGKKVEEKLQSIDVAEATEKLEKAVKNREKAQEMAKKLR